MTAARGDLSFSRREGGLALWVHVTPRARSERVGGTHGGALRLAVTEAPVGGAANAACVRALANALGVRRADVWLDPGARGRRKRVRVSGDSEALAARARELAARGAGE